MNADFWKVAPVLMEALLMGTAAAKTVRYPARAEPPLPRLKAHPRAPWLAYRPACASHVDDRHLSGDESRDANVANGSIAPFRLAAWFAGMLSSTAAESASSASRPSLDRR